MPIRILEMHLKVNVNAAASSPNSTQGAVGGITPNNGENAENEIDKDAIISECVEQVMAILRDKLVEK